MNLLNRANSFLKGSGKKLALTVVPLAILAAPAAKAVTAVPSFNLTDSSISGSGIPAGSIGWDGLGVFQGVSGISLYTSQITGALECESESDCSGAVYLSWSGDFGASAPSFPGPVPISWEFTASPDFTWHLWVDVGGNALDTGVKGPAIAGGTMVSGVGSVVAGGDNDWLVELDIYWQGVAAPTYSLEVPRNRSLDLNNADDAVPEPASLLLVGPVLGLLLLKRRRARR